MFRWILMVVSTLFIASAAFASPVDIESVDVKKRRSGTYSFKALITHKDVGWKDFFHHWEIIAPNGSVLAVQEFSFPDETKASRRFSLHKVSIPDSVHKVTVRGFDTINSSGGKTIEVVLP